MAAKKKRRSKNVKKKSTKRQIKKKSRAKKGKTVKQKSRTKKQAIPTKQIIGVVTHYFPHVNAAVVKLKKPLAIGDSILIKGKTTNLEQKIESMQIDHVAIQKAKKGDEIGLQVVDRVREHDLVLAPA